MTCEALVWVGVVVAAAALWRKHRTLDHALKRALGDAWANRVLELAAEDDGWESRADGLLVERADDRDGEKRWLLVVDHTDGRTTSAFCYDHELVEELSAWWVAHPDRGSLGAATGLPLGWPDDTRRRGRTRG